MVACRRWQNRSILNVCEEFASKQDAEITVLYPTIIKIGECG